MSASSTILMSACLLAGTQSTQAQPQTPKARAQGSFAPQSADPAPPKLGAEPKAKERGQEEELEVEVVIDTPAANDGAEQVLETQEALQRAGTQGDVVAAVRTLPGVARSSPSSGELSLWGALPSQSRLYVDDIPVPRLFHWGLARSVLPASQIKSMRIEPVAFSADYGRAIGGMANIRLSSPLQAQDRQIHSQLDLSLLEAAAALQQRATPRLGWSAALRHSLQAQVMRGLLPASRRELYPLADNFDYQIALEHKQSADITMGIRIFGAHSRQRIARASQEIARQFSQTRSDHFHRLAFFLRQDQSKVQRRALFWLGTKESQSEMSWQQGRIQAGRALGAFQGGLRLSAQHWFTDRIWARFGLDGEWELGRYDQQGSQTLPAREGDPRVWGQVPGPEFSEDAWRIARFFFSPFVTLTGYLSESWSISVGTRVQSSVSSGNRQWPERPTDPSIGIFNKDFGFSPRLALKWTRSRYDHWTLRAGIHRQLAAPQDLSPRFGNPKLQSARAYQVALALNLFPHPSLKGDLTFFWNQQKQLVTRNLVPSPALTENLLNQGLGRNWGTQLQLRYSPWSWLSAIAHYSFTMAEKKDTPLTAFRPTDLASRHQAQALVSARSGPHWTFSGRFQWSNGFPRTPVVGAFMVDQGSSFAPIFGPTNSDALPNFWSAALRVAYQKSWGQHREQMLRVWLDVQNLSNHPNVEEFSFSYDYSQRYEMPGLPIFPSLGLTMKR